MQEKIKIGDYVMRTEGNYEGFRKGMIAKVVGIHEDAGYYVSFNGRTAYTSNNKVKKVEGHDGVKRKFDIEKLNEKMKGFMKPNNNNEIEEVKYEINSIKGNINNLNRKLRQEFINLREKTLKLTVLQQAEIEDANFISDLKALSEHPLVNDVKVEDEYVYVYTDYIDISDHKGNMFRGNKYRLMFNYDKMSCKIFGLDDDYSRVSYWAHDARTESNDEKALDPHPHVNGKDGSACWGEAGSMLSMAMNEYEIYASFIIVLNFLQQVNVDDPAGIYIRNWDCIDENDEIIDNPYYIEMIDCIVCGYEMEEEDAYRCDCCEEHMCADHYRYIERTDEYICDNCFENEYGYCEETEEIYHNDVLYTCDDCGKTYHKDYVTIIDDSVYCKYCIEDNANVCSDCGEYKLIDDTFTCEECGETYCTDCRSKDEYNERTVCDICYQDLVEQEEEEENEC